MPQVFGFSYQTAHFQKKLLLVMVDNDIVKLLITYKGNKHMLQKHCTVQFYVAHRSRHAI